MSLTVESAMVGGQRSEVRDQGAGVRGQSGALFQVSNLAAHRIPPPRTSNQRLTPNFSFDFTFLKRLNQTHPLEETISLSADDRWSLRD
jgi:hypothetical protein